MGEITVTQKTVSNQETKEIKLFSIILRGKTVDDFMVLRKPEIKGM